MHYVLRDGHVPCMIKENLLCKFRETSMRIVAATENTVYFSFRSNSSYISKIRCGGCPITPLFLYILKKNIVKLVGLNMHVEGKS